MLCKVEFSSFRNYVMGTTKTEVMIFSGLDAVRTKELVNGKGMEQVRHFAYFESDIVYDSNRDKITSYTNFRRSLEP